MADNRSGRPRRNLDLIAPVTIGLVVAAILAWAVMRPKEKTPAPAPPAPPPTAEPAVIQPPPKIVEPEPTLTRADIIAASQAAASAYAAGEAPDSAKDPLVGRTFALRIPFGCDGPQVQPGGAQAYYELDPKGRSIRLVARPGTWSQLPLIQGLPAAERPENVEGFWIPRPWTSADACPPPRDQVAPASPTPPAAPTLGLARLFDAGASRVDQRRNRPYDYVVKAEDGAALTPPEGFELEIQGRITGFPDGRAIRCWSESANHRPICLFAVTFDRVAFEDPGGALISEWKD